jgi:hypothetical protein
METFKHIGLDDQGRQVILSRVGTDDREEWFEVVMSIDTDTNVMTVIRYGRVQDPAVKAACKSEMYAAEMFSSTTVTGRFRGMGKTQLLMGAYGSGLRGLSSVSVDSLTVLDEAGKPRVKMGLLHKQQGHVNRKPQPNKGPLGKRDWK